MDAELLGTLLGVVLPLYPVLFVIHQKLGRYDEVTEEFRHLQEEHDRMMEAHHG